MTWRHCRDVDLDCLIDQSMDMIKSGLTPKIIKEKIIFDIKGKVIMDKNSKKIFFILEDDNSNL